jgi:hypothetical protein
MQSDAKFYFEALSSLSTSLSDRRLRELVATMCPGVNADAVIREFHAVREILELEARDEHVERLHAYINVIPRYDDPARIKLIKDML